MNTTGVHGAFREMWETRPARPRDDRQIAGVAAAVARRYDIDPVLVRIGFVVTAFLGIGAPLYIAGWLVLPESPPDPAVAKTPRRGLLMAGLVIAAIVSMGTVFRGHGSVVLPLLATLGLLFLLHRSRADRGITGPGRAFGPTQAPTDDRGATVRTGGVSLVKGVAADAPTDGPRPPSWDPLGAAPFAWDLPEPGPVNAPPPSRRRPPVTLVTLGLALLAGAATSGVLLLSGSLSVLSAPVVLGAVLAVLGLGLVVGAVLHAGRGLIPFALLVSLMAWGVLSAPLARFAPDGFGDARFAPKTLAQLQPQYRRAAGDVTLDLRGLDLSGTAAVPTGPGGSAGPAGTDVATSVEVGAGDATVLLPDAADVRFTGSSGLGDVQFGGDREESGPGADMSVPIDLGSDGVRQGRLLVIAVKSGAGDVAVRRG